MTKVLADTYLSQRLRETRETVQVVDETGQTLDFFDPLPVAAPGIAAARSPFSNEQIEELRKQHGGRPLADIIRDLERGG